MTGQKGQTWKNRKKCETDALTWKDTTALTQRVGKKVQAKANKEKISRSAVIRQCVEKVFNK